MKKKFIYLVLFMLIATQALPEPISGVPGSSARWGSGWVDISQKDFKRGDTITIKVGGEAKKVLVRFLSRGDDPNDPVGIEGEAIPVKNKTVKLTLQQDHPQVVQISVHGGSNPWGYNLGDGNGPATIHSIDILPASK